jgi:hypothetical protein
VAPGEGEAAGEAVPVAVPVPVADRVAVGDWDGRAAAEALPPEEAVGVPVADLVDWPVSAGGALLYPLSFGAAAWLMRMPVRMRNDVRVIGFACAHSRSPDTFEKLHGTLAASVAVMRWSLRLACSRDALEASVDVALGFDDYVEVRDVLSRKRDPESAHWGAFIRALCTRYPGTTGAYWTWQVSREHAYAMLAQAEADLPPGTQTTEYESEATGDYRSLVEHLKGGGSLDG